MPPTISHSLETSLHLYVVTLERIPTKTANFQKRFDILLQNLSRLFTRFFVLAAQENFWEKS